MLGDALEPIAVVGFSFRYPQEATTPQAFWEMIASRRCAMTGIPSSRWNAAAFVNADPKWRKGYAVKGGHFIAEDVDAFDAPFFSITPAEATAMDPHQRIILEEVYHALENAGIPIERVKGTDVSVHTSSFADDYRLRTFRDPDALPAYCGTGTEIGMLSNRVSWFFDFHGPSTNLDSACSGSLMAVDHACTTLRNRDASLSVVAAGALVMDPANVISLANMGFLSQDSRCYSFDYRANGYAKGEGVGVVILQRLSDAVREGNPIRAVIRATHTNANGYNPGITQPSKDAQEALIRRTYLKAGLSMADTEYTECHGTGTALGDIAEANGLGAAFSERAGKSPMLVTSVKANIGHLEGGAGIAGLIKTCLVLESGVIPPAANFIKCPPAIDAVALNIKFPLECTPWPSKGLRRASINSFGFGGTNAHAIIEDAFHYCKARNINALCYTRSEPPSVSELGDWSLAGDFLKLTRFHVKSRTTAIPKTNGFHNGNGKTADDSDSSEAEWTKITAESTSVIPNQSISGGIIRHLNGHCDPNIRDTEHTSILHRPSEDIKLLVISSADSKGTSRIWEAYLKHFKEIKSHLKEDPHYLDDLAYTLAKHRSNFHWRSSVVVDGLDNLLDPQTLVSQSVRCKAEGRLCFVFTGQGAQWPLMGRDLCRFGVFEESLLKSQELLIMIGSKWLLLDELWRSEDSRIHQAELSQPLCTAIQIALVDLMRSFDVSPSLVIGHSSGEIAAAYALGALSHESALKVAFHRGRLAAKAIYLNGGMMVARLTESELSLIVEQLSASEEPLQVSIGCFNSPGNITLTGDKQHLAKLKEHLTRNGVFTRDLRVDVAYHSSHMQAISSEYLQSIGELQVGDAPRGEITMLSTVTANIVTSKALCEGSYWVGNLVSPVRFSEVVQMIYTKSSNVVKPVHHFLEIGPHCALQAPIQEISRLAPGTADITYASCLRRGASSIEALLKGMGDLFCSGYPLDIAAVNRHGSMEYQPKLLIDLPTYAFDHSRSYSLSGRFDRNYRHRQHRRNELLGTSAFDHNPHDRFWQNVFNKGELPWLDHHKITGSVIYPAPGMVVMAIEAMNQITIDDESVKGFELKDIKLRKTLQILDKGTETRISLRPIVQVDDSTFVWHEFILYVYEANTFQECCRGKVRATNYSLGNSVHWKAFHLAQDNCTSPVSKGRFYRHLKQCGLDYGPTFQRLDNMQYDGRDEALAHVTTFEYDNESVDQFSVHIVHPTTLDAIMHSIFIVITDGATKAMPTNIPTYIDHIYVSKSGFRHPGQTMGRLHTRCERLSVRTAESSTALFPLNSTEPLITVTGLQTTTVSDANTSEYLAAEDSLCFGMVTKPDLTLLSNNELERYFRDSHKLEGSRDEFRELTTFLFETLRHAHDCLRDLRTDTIPYHLQKYIEWMNYIYEKTGRNANSTDLLPSPISDSELDYLGDKVSAYSALGKLFAEVGRHLQEFLRGEGNVHELLFSGGLVAEYYREVYQRTNFNQCLSEYLDLLAHKNPRLRILEIGAGTGGATAAILNNLSCLAGTDAATLRFERYTFTDVSPSFFHAARERLGPVAQNLDFALYDVERDPESQNFELGSYDLIVAFSVLHLADDLSKTIQSVRRLLKPGGKLIMSEIVRPEILRGSFIWGLFPEWWKVDEKDRRWGPCVTEERWGELLAQNGFSGLDLVVRDFKDDLSHEMSLMISTASDEKIEPLVASVSIVFEEASSFQIQTAEALKAKLNSQGWLDVSTETLEAATAADADAARWYVCLLDLDKPFLSDLNSEEFEIIKTFLLAANNILWVTQDSRDGGSAAHGIIHGLSRTLRTERTDLSFISLGLDPRDKDINRGAEYINQVLAVSSTRSTTAIIEDEYVIVDGLVNITRLKVNEFAHQSMTKLVSPNDHNEKTIALAGNDLTLQVEHPGILSSLSFAESKFEQSLGTDEVEIQVIAAGIDEADLLSATGKIHRNWLGSGCAGIVTRSSSVEFAAGDSVLACASSSLRTFTRAPASLVAKKPGELNFSDAASLPSVYTLAYYTVVHVARICAGDCILVHGATSGIGQAAVQIARAYGADIYVTATSTEARKLLSSGMGIAESRIFNLHQGVFLQDEHVDVILDPFGDERTETSINWLTPGGRYIDISLKNVARNAEFQKDNVSYSRVDFGSLLQNKQRSVVRSFAAVKELLREGRLPAISSLEIYPASQAEDAFRFVQDVNHLGKAVVEFKADDLVKLARNKTPATSLSPDATFLISGGLGGLGRDIAEWIVECGGRHLILLSRTGPTVQNMPFINKLRRRGVEVAAHPCDITSLGDLEGVLESCASMPPIKGCVQAAVVMDDLTFERVSFESWQRVTGPKVAGSYNLHQLLPKDLDFFILLSSMIGVFGNASQGSYAAANTYQDALASYRRSLGLKATSLDLGAVSSIGQLAEDENMRARTEASGHFNLLSSNEVQAMMVLAIENRAPVQLVSGIRAPSSITASGKEVPYWMQRPLFLDTYQTGKSTNSIAPTLTVNNLNDLLKQATKVDEAANVITDALLQKLSRILSISEDTLDTQRPMSALGIDSMVAVDIRNWFLKEVHADIAIFDIMGRQEMREIAAMAARRVWEKRN